MNIALYAHHGPQFFRCAGKQFYYFLMKRGKKMKKLSKTLLSVAAVTAVSAAMAASAMAATMTATYDAETGMVTLSDVASTGDSQTLLVVGGNSVGATVATDDIKQIDQDDTGNVFTTVPVGQLDDGTYEVRIGGDGQIQRATFTVGDVVGPTTETLIIGDVDSNKEINTADAARVAAKGVGKEVQGYNDNVGTEYTVVSGGNGSGKHKIGDVDFSNTIDTGDAGRIAAAAVGNMVESYNGYVGTEITVEVPAAE